MLTVETRIATEQAGRYLVRLCTHAASMGRAQGHGTRVHLNETLSRGDVDVQTQWSETHGTITFRPWGRCEVAATPAALVLRIEAADEEYLRRIQDIVTRDLDRFSGSEKLAIGWRRTDATPNVARSESTNT